MLLSQKRRKNIIIKNKNRPHQIFKFSLQKTEVSVPAFLTLQFWLFSKQLAVWIRSTGWSLKYAFLFLVFTALVSVPFFNLQAWKMKNCHFFFFWVNKWKIVYKQWIIIPIISMVIFIDKFHQVARLRSCNFMFWWGLPSLPTKEKENVVMDMEIVQNNGPS